MIANTFVQTDSGERTGRPGDFTLGVSAYAHARVCAQEWMVPYARNEAGSSIPGLSSVEGPK